MAGWLCFSARWAYGTGSRLLAAQKLDWRLCQVGDGRAGYRHDSLMPLGIWRSRISQIAAITPRRKYWCQLLIARSECAFHLFGDERCRRETARDSRMQLGILLSAWFRWWLSCLSTHYHILKIHRQSELPMKLLHKRRLRFPRFPITSSSESVKLSLARDLRKCLCTARFVRGRVRPHFTPDDGISLRFKGEGHGSIQHIPRSLVKHKCEIQHTTKLSTTELPAPPSHKPYLCFASIHAELMTVLLNDMRALWWRWRLMSDDPGKRDSASAYFIHMALRAKYTRRIDWSGLEHIAHLWFIYWIIQWLPCKNTKLTRRHSAFRMNAHTWCHAYGAFEIHRYSAL